MSPLRRLLLRLLNTLRHRGAEDELAREMDAHLGVLEDDYRRRGLSDRDARLAARRAMNGVEQTKDAHRDARAFVWLEDFARDVRHALRMMRRDKGWTAVVVLSLALGIGANTAIFGAVNGMLVRTLPVADPDSLVRLRSAGRNEMRLSSNDYGFSGPDALGRPVRATFSYPIFRQLEDANHTLRDMAACAPLGRLNVGDGSRTDVADGFAASGTFFQMLGVSAELGRTLLPADDDAAAPPVAVVSRRYWLSRFGGDPGIVGHTIRVNNVPVSIVGVLPASFTGVQRVSDEPPDISVPVSLSDRLVPPEAARLDKPTIWWLQVIGRLHPGATLEQVQGNLGGVFQASARAGLDSYLASLSADERSHAVYQDRTAVPDLLVDSASRGIYDVGGSDRQTIVILSAVVGLVLLLVCANVANLLLSRSTARQREFAVRESLGASRGRLVRQLLAECLLLAAAGGSAGVAIGYASRPLLPQTAGRAFTFDGTLLAFAAALTIATGLVFGLAPAMRASRSLDADLKAAGRGVVASRSRLARSLLVVQVAISLVLLVGAGLFLRTVGNLRAVDVGFDPDGIVLFRVDPLLSGYSRAQLPELYSRITDRLEAVPGVRAVGASHIALLSGASNTDSMFIEGQDAASGRDAFKLVVSPGFFDALHIPIVTGRGFGASDTQRSPKVAVINRTAAREFFPGQDPIGQRFGGSVEQNTDIEIVGVVGDVKYNSLRDAPPPTFFVPALQSPAPRAFFAVRAAVDPLSLVGALREAVRQIDPNLPMTDITTQAAEVEERLLQERLFARACSLFGGLATLVAAIGLFGLMSYSVARRTNEIGIRMTLGAEPRGVLGLVLRESMALVGIGIAIGLVAAMAAGRLVASQLYGLAPTDPLTAAGAAALMVAAAAIAAYIPARRASRVDPMVALRCE